MARTVSKRFRKTLLAFVLIGLLALPLGLWWWTRPKQIITRALRRANVDPQTIKYWVCVSAFETDGWTSGVFKQGNNLFGMTLAPSDTTAIGTLDNAEHSARYNSVGDSADDIVLYMTKRFHYPLSFASIDALVAYMFQKDYFTGDPLLYTAGVKDWYVKIYG